MRDRSKLFDVTVSLLHETPNAWLVDGGEGEKSWIPKSFGEMDKNTDGTWNLTAPEWLLKERKLI